MANNNCPLAILTRVILQWFYTCENAVNKVRIWRVYPTTKWEIVTVLNQRYNRSRVVKLSLSHLVTHTVARVQVPTMLEKKVLLCNAGHQEVGRCHTRVYPRIAQATKGTQARVQPGSETQARCQKKSKAWCISRPTKKDLSPPKF